MNKNFILPFQKEYLQLEKIVSGKQDMSLTRESARGIYDDDEDLTAIAQDIYETAVATRGDMNRFSDVLLPSFDDANRPIIRVVLSEEGQRVYSALKDGWVVDRTTNDISVEETIRFYENMLEKGAIREDYARVLISNKDERLRDLRGKLTLFRLVGKRHEGFIEESDDVQG